MPRFQLKDLNLYYEVAGEGEAIVFLHGFTGSTRDWENQVAVLKDRYKTIAVDHRGHGRSDAPARETDYAINLFSEDVYALLRHLGISRCCVVGHSMGGFMALQFALDHPDMLRGLVLVDTSSGEFDAAPGYAELRAKLDQLASEEGLEAAFDYDAAHNPMRIETFKRNPSLRDSARQRVMNTSVDGYVFVPKTFGKWQPVTERLHEIKVPACIFWGDQDHGFKRPSAILKENILESELVTVSGVGHNPHEEAPHIFNDSLLGYLQKIVW